MKAYKHIVQKLFFASLLLFSLYGPSPFILHAQTDSSYKMLASDTPLSDSSGNTDIGTFLPRVFKLGIGIAGALAVLYIIIGGIEYLSTDSIDGRSGGKEKINNALLGLVLAISAYAILSTINPNLVNLSLKIGVLPQAGPIAGIGSDDQTKTNPIGPTGCSNCNPLPAPLLAVTKPPAAQGKNNGACAYPGPCVASVPLTTDLNKINIAMGKGGWQITELFPPTVPHESACHDRGTCADATVSDKSDAGLTKFFSAIQSSGSSSYEYEVCGNPTRLADLNNKKQTVFKNLNVKFACEKTTTGSTNSTGAVSESVHINQ